MESIVEHNPCAHGEVTLIVFWPVQPTLETVFWLLASTKEKRYFCIIVVIVALTNDDPTMPAPPPIMLPSVPAVELSVGWLISGLTSRANARSTLRSK